MGESVRSLGLWCRWTSWSVVGERELRLDVPAGNCPDKRGCIIAALGLMPDVAKIKVDGLVWARAERDAAKRIAEAAEKRAEKAEADEVTP